MLNHYPRIPSPLSRLFGCILFCLTIVSCGQQRYAFRKKVKIDPQESNFTASRKNTGTNETFMMAEEQLVAEEIGEEESLATNIVNLQVQKFSLHKSIVNIKQDSEYKHQKQHSVEKRKKPQSKMRNQSRNVFAVFSLIFAIACFFAPTTPVLFLCFLAAITLGIIGTKSGIPIIAYVGLMIGVLYMVKVIGWVIFFG